MSRTGDLHALFTTRRDEWDPSENTPAANRVIDNINRFEAHHTGGPGPSGMSFQDKAVWLKSIEAYHENTKGWTDIFYHVFIFADGEIWEGRRADRTSQSDIARTLTVHFPGNNPTVTAAQHDSALRVARWCTKDPIFLSFHSERAASVCPGNNVRALVSRLREEINTMTNTQPDLTNLIPQDLGTHDKYLEAVRLGFISDVEPGRVASRSVVGIVATNVWERADAANLGQTSDIASIRATIRTLGRRVATLEATIREIQAPSAVDIDAIVAEIRRRLEG